MTGDSAPVSPSKPALRYGGAAAAYLGRPVPPSSAKRVARGGLYRGALRSNGLNDWNGLNVLNGYNLNGLTCADTSHPVQTLYQTMRRVSGDLLCNR